MFSSNLFQHYLGTNAILLVPQSMLYFSVEAISASLWWARSEVALPLRAFASPLSARVFAEVCDVGPKLRRSLHGQFRCMGRHTIECTVHLRLWSDASFITLLAFHVTPRSSIQVLNSVNAPCLHKCLDTGHIKIIINLKILKHSIFHYFGPTRVCHKTSNVGSK